MSKYKLVFVKRKSKFFRAMTKKEFNDYSGALINGVLKSKDKYDKISVLLAKLFKQGKKVFGSHYDFDNWLREKNFYFDKKEPCTFLNSQKGIKFISDRLVGMEYGDNA